MRDLTQLASLTREPDSRVVRFSANNAPEREQT